MISNTLWRCGALALIVLSSACSRQGAAGSPPPVLASSATSVSAVASPASAIQPQPATTGRCDAAREVLASCAYESSCSAEMTLFLPAAARDRLVTLEKVGGFDRTAFNRYCEQACRSKSPQVDLAAFAHDVCPESAAAPSNQTGASATPTLKFTVGGGLVLDMRPVDLEKVKSALGAPVKSEPSPYQCDSAYESEGTRLLTFRTAVFETDGKTAVLRQVTAGPSVDVQFNGLSTWADVTLERLQSLPGIEKLQVDDHTLRLAPAAGASLETGWDFRFREGRLSSVDHWIGC